MAVESEFCVVLTTTGSSEEANRLAASLVSERLAACVQITEITSHYVWEGNAHKDKEYLLALKTRLSLYPGIEAFIRKEHSYEVPELVLLPIETGLEAYLNWIKDNTG
jgi:periplasmic divalent cation tolerance protein